MRYLTIAVAVLIGFYVVVAWAIGLPPFPAHPTYYTTFDSDAPIERCGGAYSLRFENSGRVAVVRLDERDLRLQYQPNEGRFEEVYRSGPWTLTLDPQIKLSGPRGIRFLDC